MGSGARSLVLPKFSLVILSCPPKVRNVNCEQRCKGKSIPNKSSLSGWKGVPSHKCARVNNNSKSEILLLEQKVEDVVMVISRRPRGAKLLVVGDSNADLDDPEGSMISEEIAEELVANLLDYTSSHFLPSSNPWSRDRFTWSI